MLTILCGDALTKLRELPDESVQCCVTSPPYWGLRDYGTASWEGPVGANIASTIDWRDCDHKMASVQVDRQFSQASTLVGYTTRQEHHGSTRNSKESCPKCGAKRIDSQLGLEKTPEEYVAKMVEVFREVRRVLRKDGTLWLNLGDSYASNWPCNRRNLIGEGSLTNGKREARPPRLGGLKEKDLVGIPWRVAFALQADGWYLRQDIIWAKPNPMPESVTDRCTKSHEYMFLLTKSARYFYDAEAIKEQSETPMDSKARCGFGSANGKCDSMEYSHSNETGKAWEKTTNRNKRSVWTVTTQPYPDAHFATYPPDLIKPCIMAGSRSGDTIVDPFAGSGTTGMVALELGRKSILIELNPKYVKLIEQRCDVTVGLPL